MCWQWLFNYQYLVVSSDVDAFELVERIDDVVQVLLFVPCEVEANMLCCLLLIHGFHLVESCNIVQNYFQFSIFVDNGLALRAILLCKLRVESWELRVCCGDGLLLLCLLRIATDDVYGGIGDTREHQYTDNHCCKLEERYSLTSDI